MSFSISKLIEPCNHSFTVGSFSQKMKEVKEHLSLGADYIALNEYKSMKEYALEYANLGHLVIPLHYPTRKGCSCKKISCSSVGKHPMTKNGLHDASKDTQQIDEWWHQFPMANIGLLTGSITNFVVLDADKKSQGLVSLENLMREFAEFPQSKRVKSGGDGLHIYFRCPEIPLSNRVGFLAGLDLRADGGYIVAPPSVHVTGNRYTWITEPDAELEGMPAWLCELAGSKAKSPNSIAGVKTGLIEPGRRNQALASMAGLLRRHGLNEKAILSGLRALNREICDPGLPDDEVTKIAISIAGYQSPMAWPTAQPLPPIIVEVQVMSEDFLPSPFRAWIIDVADRMQVPLEYIAIPAIVAAASVIGRKLSIRPDALDSWTVIPNLWGFIVADPGSLKSPAIAEAMRPLEILAKRSQASFEEQCKKLQIEEKKLIAEIELIKEHLKMAKRDGLLEEAIKQQKLLIRLQEEQVCKKKIIEKRYKTSDPTPEKLAVLLQENPQGILLLRDELSGWLESFKQRGKEGSREFYLEAWNGTNSFSIDRIGRGTIHIDALCLSIFGGIQPTKLANYIERTTGPGGDDGFLERFQLAIFPGKLKEWKLVSRLPDQQAVDQAITVFELLDGLDGALFCADKACDVPYLRFSAEAQTFVDSYRKTLEQKIRSDDRHPIIRAHLSKYRSLMPSLALIFSLLESMDERISSVDCGATQLAIKWCDYLESHATKIYQDLLHEKDVGARILAEKIKCNSLFDGEKIRDLNRRNWRGLNSPEKLNSAIKTLTDFGWVSVESINTIGGISDVLRINPELPEGDMR